MLRVNFKWNNHIELDSKALPEFKHLSGEVWEFLLPDEQSEYRIFRSFHNNNYYIYSDRELVSVIGCSGDIEEYQGIKVTSNRVALGKEYTNLTDSPLRVNAAGYQFYIEDKLVAEIGEENRFTWLLKSFLKFKILSYDPWDGIKFDEKKISKALALTLLISEAVNSDT